MSDPYKFEPLPLPDKAPAPEPLPLFAPAAPAVVTGFVEADPACPVLKLNWLLLPGRFIGLTAWCPR